MIEQQAISRNELISEIGKDATLITGNSRLARSILADYDQHQLRGGQLAWQTPDILSVRSWLRRTWEDLLMAGELPNPPVLLSQDQELHLWYEIVSQHPESLLRTQATARKARDAWQLMLDWRLRREQATFSVNEDSQAFSVWAETFEQQCHARHWISECEIPGRLIERFRRDYPLPAKDLVWAGFEELSPVLTELQQSLSAAGVTLRNLDLNQPPARIGRFTAKDSRAETEAVVRWTRHCLDRNPDARIGIIVPDQSAVRSMLTDKLTRVLVPDVQVPGQQMQSVPWNFSLGQPLAAYPVIRIAFRLLDLVVNRIEVRDTGALLRTPYIAGAVEEFSDRCMLDVQLRQSGEPWLSLSALAYQIGRYRGVAQRDDAEEGPATETLSELSRRIAGLLELYKTIPEQAGANAWAVWFGKCLTVAGWACGRTLCSDEYQAVEAWKKLLIDFGALENIAGEFSVEQALTRLKHIAAARIFQPQSADVPVQVLGLYEAIGLEFDHAWVMGMHDAVWPPAPRPDPFIPLVLQLKHDMPHASQERELSVAGAITERLCGCAQEVVFSYPQHHAEEELGPSPLILDFPVVEIQDLQLWPGLDWCERVRQSAKLVRRDDDQAPPVSERHASGGSAIFRHQALCPFRAFAEHRLGAVPMDQPHLGLDAKQRGLLLHKSLELLWQRLQTQQRLLQLTTQDQQQWITAAVNEAIEQNKGRHPHLFQARLRQVETRRLVGILTQWLELEKQRSPFSVTDFEKDAEATINGIAVRLKIDRIDELADGSKLIIDYKSGRVNPGDWFGERPADPQLPLYSAVEGGDIAAVLFAQLRAGDLAYKGVVKDEDMIPGLPPARGNKLLKEVMQDWPAILEQWQQEIKRLAGEFRGGNASIDPKDGVITCQSSYCKLAAFCRINDQRWFDPDAQENGNE